MANTSNAIHGKSAVLYAGPAAGASPIAEQVDWSIDFAQPLVDVSPLGNTWKNFVKGMMEWTAAFAGNFDHTSTLIWTEAIGSTKSNIYLYPMGAADMSVYYYGTGWITPGKLAAGSTTAKASSSFKVTGDGPLLIK